MNNQEIAQKWKVSSVTVDGILADLHIPAKIECSTCLGKGYVAGEQGGVVHYQQCCRCRGVGFFAGQVAPQATVLPEEIIAGALFDFMGFLTTRNEVITLSSHHEAGPAVEALRAFADKRQFNLDEAKVADWMDYRPVQATVEPLTDEQLLKQWYASSRAVWSLQDCILHFARALLATPPTSKATVLYGWQFDISDSDDRTWLTIKSPQGTTASLGCATKHASGETIPAQVLHYLRDELAAAPTANYCNSSNGSFDTSKADTGSQTEEQRIGTYREGWNAAILETHTRCESWAEARKEKRGGDALRNFAQDIYKMYSPLKSATPSTVKEEPTAPAYTTGHCEAKKQKGGCPHHNVHCGYPDCDRRPTGEQL